MNAKVLDIPPTFWGLVEARVAATPDAPFLEDEHGTSLTFAGYRDASERVAAGLQDIGIGAGSVVAWQLPTAIDSAVLMAALSRLGSTQVPIIPILREREVTYITRQSGCDWLLVRSEWRNFDYRGLAEAVAAEVGFAVLTVDSLPESEPLGLPVPPTEQEAYERRWLYYTSGSTADPKGVWHRDASAMAASNAWIQGFEPTSDDLFPMAVPFTHIAGVAMTTTSLRTGMRLMLMEAFDPEQGPLVMAEHGATLLGGALPLFVAFLAAQRAHGPAPLWPRLRVGISGGASKPTGLHQEVKDLLGGAGVVG
ncbi:MAG TPA: class I adenylate-forming enzyme family protein, partial [Acidimicrobiales bacterium]|nr:class I adenylate-forming enzyme family protein [Acidimicrobiales bacterium]